MSEQALHSKIILIGFMGTGKSSVANQLSANLGWKNIDVDAEIVSKEKRPISSIFEKDGEESFRHIETAMLKQLLSQTDNAIIATGGGAVLKEENCSLMLKHGFVVALTASADCIIERVKYDTSRPLLQGDLSERVHRLLKEREHAYEFAHLELDTTLLSIPQVVTNILESWHNFINLK